MYFRLLTGFVLFVAWASIAMGGPILIDTYDVLHTEPSGYGNWWHTYTGTITPEGSGVYTYTGGSGTLNDGIIGNSAASTHLFASTVTPPVITLNLAGAFSVDSILIYGGTFTGNSIPGRLTGMTVTIGGVSVALTSTPTGPSCDTDGYCNDLFTLTGTALEGVTGDTITLSSATPAGNFSITEIELDGVSASGVPEPGTLALLGAGLAGLAVLRRRIRRA